MAEFARSCWLVVALAAVFAVPTARAQSCLGDLVRCNATLVNVTQSLSGLQAQYDNCGCGQDPCAASVSTDYDLGLHIAAVFIILAASALGTFIPLLTNRYRKGIVPYLVCLGKCTGTGAILGLALIHMLLPANASLTSPCVPTAFNTEYTAYAYLFALLAALAMQFLDYVLIRAMNKRQAGVMADSSAQDSLGMSEGSQEALRKKSHEGHVHAVLPLEVGVQKTVGAYMLEFGVAVHSIFIGLAVGVVGDSELTALLVALVFHQFFEGLALGSRLAEAHLPSRLQEVVLALIYAVSAPIGIAIGIGVASSLDPNSTAFLLVQGIFDAICAGILLYIGFSLLFHDFPEDMEEHCAGKERETARRTGMFLALWFGAGIMAFIGRYL
jgi:solute carrier family 39 (zinc transporter), member 1/2/3